MYLRDKIITGLNFSFPFKNISLHFPSQAENDYFHCDNV